jgi:hypothetical protein
MINNTIAKNYSFDGIDVKVCFDARKVSNAPKDLNEVDKVTIRNIIKDLHNKKDGMKND